MLNASKPQITSLTVAKFGGTRVADFAAMKRSATIIKKNPNARLVLISACSGVTNILVALAAGVTDADERQQHLTNLDMIHLKILSHLQDPNRVDHSIQGLLDHIGLLAEQAAAAPSLLLTDQLVANGELLSTHLFTQILQEIGVTAHRFDIRKVLRTNSQFGQAIPDLNAISALSEQHLLPKLQDHVVVSQGFIGANEQGLTTTLGRGGSDYSAALMAEAINAETLEIWTDVPGIYTTDPRIANKAKPISEISFSEASEMANFGAKILHPSTLVPAIRQQIPVFVGSSKMPDAGGTWIKETTNSSPLFRALTLRCNQTMVTLTSLNMFHNAGFLAEVFRILSKYQVSVDLITTSEVSVSLTLDQTNTSGGAPSLPDAALNELTQLCSVDVEKELCLVALIGNNMSQTSGSVSDIFTHLNDYDLRMICFGASPHNVCFLAKENKAKHIVKRLHQALFENK